MKRHSLFEIKQCISGEIKRGHLNVALRLIHDAAERMVTEPLCVGEPFGSKELDDLCQKIGERNLILLDDLQKKVPDKKNQVIVYIVTKLQKSGGHTRMIKRLIASRPTHKHIVLLTGLAGASDTHYLIDGSSSALDLIIVTAPNGSFQKKLTWLQMRLIKIGPEHIYLFNHPQDSVAVAAVQPSMELKTSFYHHVDHYFSLGVFLSYVTHIDIHSTGYFHCRDHLGISNTYLPLVIDDKGMHSSGDGFKKNGHLITSTVGRSNKIENSYFVSYLDIIPNLLDVTKGTHVHIGKLTPWALFHLRRILKKKNIASSQFIYVEWAPSVWEALHQYGVDLYIASFPYVGNLSLIEAMGAGIPVVLHQHIHSRILGGIDIAYSEAFRWYEPYELFDYCASITRDELSKLSHLGREHYERYYRGELFDELVNGHIKDILPPPLSTIGYSIQSDERAYLMMNEFNFFSYLKRRLYRMFRYMRSLRA